MTGSLTRPRLAAAPTPGLLAGGVAAAAAGLFAVAGLAVVGPRSVLAPAIALVMAAIVRWPRAAAFAVLASGIALDTARVDFTQPLVANFWDLPPGIRNRLPLTTNPYELLLAFTAIVVLAHPRFRARTPARLPALAWLVPPLIAAGLIYGIANGGKVNLAYHEARGLIFALLAFAMVWRLRITPRQAAGGFIAGTLVLAPVTLVRYPLYLANSGIPREIWFGHETGVFLALGSVLGGVLLLRAKSDRERWLLVIYTGVMLFATLVTGRRAAVMVLLVGMLTVGWLLLPKRPVLLVTCGMVSLLGGAAYLSAYWDANTGPLAQPARAVRSQVDPGARDRSSDTYRAIERYDLQRTIAQDEVLGIGFGRPFIQFRPLPELAFWPLQSYTPHQNLLWLWLKTGIVGVSVILGLWVVAFSRCVGACRAVPRSRDIPAGPVVLAAALLMYLSYARVDLAIITSRSAVPLAVAVALALLLPRPSTARREDFDA